MATKTKYFVTLTGGKTYWVNGKTYKEGEREEVSKELYDYLEPSVLFDNEIEEPKATTKKSTKKKEEEPTEKEGE